MQATVIIALGSNRRHGRHGDPSGVLRAAIAALAEVVAIKAVSRLYRTAPLGPKQRGYANAAVRATTKLDPGKLLNKLHRIEAAFGRTRGRKWGPRVLDLDLIAYGDVVLSGAVMLPHPEMHRRRFVLDPMLEVAPDWRHPRLRLTVRQLRARLTRPSPVRRGNARVGGS